MLPFPNLMKVNKKIVIVAATLKEIQPLHEFLEKEAVNYSASRFQFGNIEIEILITGIGILHTTYSLMDYLTDHRPDAWIQAGIGGAFDQSLETGNVYLIGSEVLFDFGAQQKDGRIMSQFELGWMDPDQFPYTNESLPCPYIPSEVLIPIASGMTTLYSHGHEAKIDQIGQSLHGQIENMEGAAFFYVSLMKHIPFLSLRSVSNIVEPRNTDHWDIPLAIRNLNDKLIFLLKEKIFLHQLTGSIDV